MTALSPSDAPMRTLWELCRACYQHGDIRPSEMNPRQRANLVKRLDALAEAVKAAKEAMEVKA